MITIYFEVERINYWDKNIQVVSLKNILKKINQLFKSSLSLAITKILYQILIYILISKLQPSHFVINKN